jgi:hypothetical protein
VPEPPPTALTAAGGWPGARLVLFGADPELTRTMAASSVPSTVPLAPDETGARRLLDRRPPLVTRRIELDHTTSSARRARSFVHAACTDWQLGMISHDAIAVASELVANAVLHAGTGCRLVLRYRTHGLRVAVYDRNPARPPVLHPLVEGGGVHGLSIVAALSLQWGVGRERDAKCVWAFLPATATTPYSHDVRAAAHDAVQAAIVHGTRSTTSTVAVSRLVARLADEHGSAFVRELGGELAGLVVELAEASSAVDDPTGRISVLGHSAHGVG